MRAQERAAGESDRAARVSAGDTLSGTSSIAPLGPIVTGTITSPEEQIRAELIAIESGATDAVGHILRAGAMLRSVRDGLPHGDWLPWLAREFPDLTRRTASRWMRAADIYRDQIQMGHGVSHMTSLRSLLGEDSPRESRDAACDSTIGAALRHLAVQCTRLRRRARKGESLTRHDVAGLQGLLDAVAAQVQA